jgi:repressor LexA
MAKMPDLTERQREVLGFIQDRIRAWGYPPTIREIGDHFDMRSTNGVVDHLKTLKRKGYLTQEGMKSRTLRPTRSPSRRGSAVRAMIPRNSTGLAIPLLRRVAAGAPILAEEHAEGTVVVDSFLVGDGRKLFALKVVGDSMIDDGIFNGDYIFVRKRAHADPGDIVVVLIEDEATVKRFYPEGNRIRLQPANSTMQPIYIEKKDFIETQIIGVVVGVYRKLPGT